MKINVLGIIKGVSELAVSAGVGVVVGNVVKATTPYDLGRTQKVLVGIGGYSLGAVLGDLSAKYVSDQIDGYAERVSSIIHPSEETVDAVNDVKDSASDLVQNIGEVAETVIIPEPKASSFEQKPSKAPKPVTDESA